MRRRQLILSAGVLLAATALPPRMTLILGAFVAVCATVLIFYHYPLPWDADDPLELPPGVYSVSCGFRVCAGVR